MTKVVRVVVTIKPSGQRTKRIFSISQPSAKDQNRNRYKSMPLEFTCKAIIDC